VADHTGEDQGRGNTHSAKEGCIYRASLVDCGSEEQHVCVCIVWVLSCFERGLDKREENAKRQKDWKQGGNFQAQKKSRQNTVHQHYCIVLRMIYYFFTRFLRSIYNRAFPRHARPKIKATTNNEKGEERLSPMYWSGFFLETLDPVVWASLGVGFAMGLSGVGAAW
jgi:hypothetical protein